MLILGAQCQVLDAFGHRDRGSCQAGEGLQGIEFQALELARGEGIEGYQAPWALVDHQRAAHAVMHLQVDVVGIDQAVIGVGQLRVAGKPGGLGAAEQNLEARMLAYSEAPAQGIGGQPVDSQWHQPFAIEPQQRSGIAGQQTAHGLQQAAVAFLVGQVPGQVTDQGEQGGEQRLCGHKDSSWSK
ncbi:hypothetical protein D3C81_1710430 [compost metagenome]